MRGSTFWKTCSAEADDGPVAPVVRVQLLNVLGAGREGVACLKAPHDRIVRVPEAVNRLLRVPHYEEAPPLGEGVVDQRQEVAPLDRGGVLELVDKVMEDRLAQPEIDIGHYLRVQVFREPAVHVLDEYLAFMPLGPLEYGAERLVSAQVRDIIAAREEPGEIGDEAAERAPIPRLRYDKARALLSFSAGRQAGACCPCPPGRRTCPPWRPSVYSGRRCSCALSGPDASICASNCSRQPAISPLAASMAAE